MSSKIIGGLGIAILAGIGVLYYFITHKPEEVLLTIPQYRGGAKAAAEEGGKERLDEYRKTILPVLDRYMTKHEIDMERRKMTLYIANSDYSGCVLAYKGSHYMPKDGWGNEPQDFCSHAIENVIRDPVVAEIIEEGAKVAVTPTDVSEGKMVHPDAYIWIRKYLKVDTTDEHYFDYQYGWCFTSGDLGSDYPKSSDKFYDRVMKHAGMTEKWLGRGWKW